MTFPVCKDTHSHLISVSFYTDTHDAVFHLNPTGTKQVKAVFEKNVGSHLLFFRFHLQTAERGQAEIVVKIVNSIGNRKNIGGPFRIPPFSKILLHPPTDSFDPPLNDLSRRKRSAKHKIISHPHRHCSFNFSMILRVCSFHVYLATTSLLAACPKLSLRALSSIKIFKPSIKDPTSPGLTNHAVWSCLRTSPIWSRLDATIPLPIAIYSNNFVGEPKKGCAVRVRFVGGDQNVTGCKMLWPLLLGH